MRILTKKQNDFCEEYVRNGYNAAAAYRVAYGQDNQNICNVEGGRNIKRPYLLTRIDQIEGEYKTAGRVLNLNKDRVMKKLVEMIEAKKSMYHNGSVVGSEPDYTTQLNAITTYLKLVGDFAPVKKDINLTQDEPVEDEFDLMKLTPEEREALKEQILNNEL